MRERREAVPPLRLKSPARPAKASRRRPPRQPRIRPRKSVVERVLPGSEPAPPRTVIRLRVVGVVMAVLFSLMFVRLWYLQVLNTSSYARTATANAVRPVEVPAARGLILDRSGSVLVGNQVNEEIVLSRVSAQQHPSVVADLAAALGLTTTQIESDLTNPQYSLYSPVPILQNAPMADVLYLGEHASQFPGVSVEAVTNRTYPICPTNPPGQCQTGAQLFGYVGQISASELASHKSQGYQLGDQYGQTGLENEYQTALRGTPGTDDVEVDAQGQVVGSAGQTAPVAGDDLVTNIDSGLEQTLQADLDAQMTQVHGVTGAAVAMDPQTGAVLALVSSPTYNPTWWNGGISYAHYQQLDVANGPLENYAIDGLYTPGSTFKLATATAALNDGLITPNFSYYDAGTYDLAGTVFHDNEGEGGYTLNVSQALTVSSDDFFYNLGVLFWDERAKYGDDAIENWANALGWGELSGIDIPGETPDARVDSPQVVAKEHAQDPAAYPDSGWYSGNNLELAFGQGGTVITPIEEAQAYATFANGGTRYQPEIAAGLVDPNTCKVAQTFAPKVTGHVAYSSADYRAILQGFEGAVQSPSGTAYGDFVGFPLSSFPIAGKTGTATESPPLQPNSWFVGWGPLPDPQYLVAAVIQGGGYGSEAAAPVVRQAFNYIVANRPAPVSLAAPAGTCSSKASPATTTTTTQPGAPSTTTSTSGLAGDATGRTAGTQALRSANRSGSGIVTRGFLTAGAGGRSRAPPGPL
ncbi:MAG TPA: penicillin-binding protein 2 [Acidimicrobiales bacterium]|nr:penicillin-binding protein 2 [Acidimicrobiales bacterium]